MQGSNLSTPTSLVYSPLKSLSSIPCLQKISQLGKHQKNTKRTLSIFHFKMMNYVRCHANTNKILACVILN